MRTLRDARIPLWPSAIHGEGMEHLWSPAGATGGNQRQIGEPRKRLKQADRQPVATHGNGSGAHGKEGGRRFESVRGLCKSAARRRFLVCVQSVQGVLRAWMELFMELSRREAGRG